MNKAHILGGGITGLVVANELKKNYDVHIYEQNIYLGGTCYTNNCNNILHEFGPHVIYFKNKEQQKFWTHYLKVNYMNYYVQASVDGTLNEDSLYDFPCSMDNLQRLDSTFVQKESEYKTLKHYFISQVGQIAYEKFFKGYNKKQWGLDPELMSTDWCKKRPLNLRTTDKRMFKDLPAGYPVNGYNNMFKQLSKDTSIHTNVCIEDVSTSKGNIDKITMSYNDITKSTTIDKDDIVISTLPLDSIFLKYANEPLGWRGVIKLFYIVYGEGMPTYSTTFPNNYKFTRVVDYVKHSGNKDSKDTTILSFAFPFNGNRARSKIYLEGYRKECEDFIEKELKQHYKYKDYMIEHKVYPIPTDDNKKLFKGMLKEVSEINNFYTSGRLGLYAYISMSNAAEKAQKLAHRILNKTIEKPRAKYDFYQMVRGDLW